MTKSKWASLSSEGKSFYLKWQKSVREQFAPHAPHFPQSILTGHFPRQLSLPFYFFFKTQTANKEVEQGEEAANQSPEGYMHPSQLLLIFLPTSKNVFLSLNPFCTQMSTRAEEATVLGELHDTAPPKASLQAVFPQVYANTREYCNTTSNAKTKFWKWDELRQFKDSSWATWNSKDLVPLSYVRTRYTEL